MSEIPNPGNDIAWLEFDDLTSYEELGIEKARERFVWTTGHDTMIILKDLTDRHLINIFNSHLLRYRRAVTRLERARKYCLLDDTDEVLQKEINYLAIEGAAIMCPSHIIIRDEMLFRKLPMM